MKLFTGGCSYTYGDGLIDTFPHKDDKKPVPSKYAWPAKLGKLLGYDVINHGWPGGSNTRAISQILSEDINKGDTVIMLWTFLTREEFFGYGTLGEWTKGYYDFLSKYSSNTDIILKNLIAIHNFTVYLESKQADIHYMFIDELHRSEVNRHYLPLYDKLIPKVKEYDRTESTFAPAQGMFARGQLEKALDGTHPGEEWHELLANKLFEYHFEHRPEFESKIPKSLI